MKPRSVQTVARWMAGEVCGSTRCCPEATGASIDSRTLARGDLFFALRGRHTDGRLHAREALEKGACAVVLAGDMPLPGARILVRDPSSSLARLAAAIREEEERDVPAAAITGSVGKTTTCRYVAELLRDVGGAHRPPSSFNNSLGVPLTILSAPPDSRYLVIEVGANAAGEVLPLARWARPRVACVTEVAPVHLAGFNDLQTVAREKLSILKALPPDGEGWIPASVARAYAELIPQVPARVRTFGAGGDVEIYRSNVAGRFLLRFGRHDPPMQFEWNPTFRHSISNLEAAIAVVAGLGVPPEAVLERITELTLPPLRGETHKHAGVEFLLDCYNSSPVALRSSIDRLLTEPVRGRRICVLGTMEELGNEERNWHRELGAQLASAQLDAVYLMGRGRDWFLEGVQGAGKEAELIADDEPSAGRLAAFLRAGDCVLFKASRKEKLENFAARVGRLLEERHVST